MRSGTSFFDWTVFKKTVCRFWPLWGAYCAIWVVLLPLNGLMMLKMDGVVDFAEDFAMFRVANAASEVSLELAVVFGALAAMAVFSHLYNARSANLFGSLPIRREGLFLTHYLAGLAFLLAPNAAIFLLTLLVEAAGGAVNMRVLLFWLAVACGECFLFYSMAVFCGLFTGHILALPAFYAVLNGIALVATNLVQMVLGALCYGYRSFGLPGAVIWLTPADRLDDSVRAWYNTPPAQIVDGVEVQRPRELVCNGLDVVGVYAIAALVLTVCAFFLYRARRLESAGDVVSVRPMRPVFKYGVALCAGLVLGMGTLFFTGGGEITLIIAIVVWGVIGYFAAQMLLDKSFRVFKKWKGAAAVAAVLLALLLVVELALTGYETRIPTPDSVESVELYGISAVNLSDGGDVLDMDISDPELIELLVTLHRAAVEQRDERHDADGIYTSLSLGYALKGGGTLERWYSVRLDPGEVDQEGTAAWAVQQIYNNRDLYWEAYGFALLENCLAQGGRLECAEYEFYDEDSGLSTMDSFYGADAQALLAAVKEDFFAGRIAVRRVEDGLSWTYYREDSLSFRTRADEDGFLSINIVLQDTASSTLAALEEMADRAVSGVDGTYYEAWLRHTDVY